MQEKINKLIQQYSAFEDNPTVLRELEKLAGLVGLIIEDNEDMEKRMEDIEAAIKDLDLDEVKALLDSIEDEVKAATETANDAKAAAETATAASNEAKTAADEAKEKADSAQPLLTFDNTPTAGSTNPVTSEGIKAAIDAIPTGSDITVDDTVTADSENPVKSSGIYEAIEAAKSELTDSINDAQTTADDAKTAAGAAQTAANDAAVDAAAAKSSASNALEKANESWMTANEAQQDVINLSKTVTSHTDDIAALQEFQQTQETTNETHNTQIAANIEELQKQSGEIAVLETDKLDKSAILSEITDDGTDDTAPSTKLFKAKTQQLIDNVNNALANKQNKLTGPSGLDIETTIAGSAYGGSPTRLVNQQAITQALNNKQNSLTVSSKSTEVTSEGTDSTLPTTKAVYNFGKSISDSIVEKIDGQIEDIDTQMADKQDKLTANGNDVQQALLTQFLLDAPPENAIPSALAVYNSLGGKQTKLTADGAGIREQVVTDIASAPSVFLPISLATAKAVKDAIASTITLNQGVYAFNELVSGLYILTMPVDELPMSFTFKVSVPVDAGVVSDFYVTRTWGDTTSRTAVVYKGPEIGQVIGYIDGSMFTFSSEATDDGVFHRVAFDSVGGKIDVTPSDADDPVQGTIDTQNVTVYYFST